MSAVGKGCFMPHKLFLEMDIKFLVGLFLFPIKCLSSAKSLTSHTLLGYKDTKEPRHGIIPAQLTYDLLCFSLQEREVYKHQKESFADLQSLSTSSDGCDTWQMFSVPHSPPHSPPHSLPHSVPHSGPHSPISISSDHINRARSPQSVGSIPNIIVLPLAPVNPRQFLYDYQQNYLQTSEQFKASQEKIMQTLQDSLDTSDGLRRDLQQLQFKFDAQAERIQRYHGDLLEARQALTQAEATTQEATSQKEALQRANEDLLAQTAALTTTVTLKDQSLDMANLELHKLQTSLSEQAHATVMLSMMACKHMQTLAGEKGEDDTSIVSACESYLPMAKLAHKVIQANGLASSINIINKRSDDIEVGIDMSSRADILVSEILDSHLIGEGIIPTFQHAHSNLLKASARTIPYSATIFGQLVECDFLWRCHDLKGVEAELNDGLSLAPSGTQWVNCCSLNQWALHVDALSSHMRLLTEPSRLLTLDFFKYPKESYRETHKIVAVEDGTAHVFVTWWLVQLDEEGLIRYSTAPNYLNVAPACDRGWCDHWRQSIWFIPGKGFSVQSGDIVDVDVCCKGTRIQYDIRLTGEQKKLLKSCDVVQKFQAEVLMKPERICFLGNQALRSTIMSSVAYVLKNRRSLRVLVLDDSLILTVCAAKSASVKHVFAMLPSLKGTGLSFLQGAAEANNFPITKVSVLGKQSSGLLACDLEGEKVDLILAEPYYMAYEDMLPWHQLHFWYERTTIRHLLDDNVLTVPCQGVLCGMAVSLPDLWKSRHSLSMVEGFDHSAANPLLGACGGHLESSEIPIVPYSLWQSGEYEILSERFTLMVFNFSHQLENVTGFAKVPICTAGVCHGLVLWMEWMMNPEDNFIISTCPSDFSENCWKQGIKLFKAPVEVTCTDCHASTLHVNGAFNSYNGEIDIDVKFLSSKRA